MKLNEYIDHQTVLFTIFALSIITTNINIESLYVLDTVLIIIRHFADSIALDPLNHL